jgi:hypothetical protein
MSALIVRREHSAWQDLIRDYGIFIDGQKAADISNGGEARIPISAGRHLVQMKIDWCRSNPLEIHVDGHGDLVLECGPNGDPFSTLLYITLWRGKYLWLKAAAAPRASKV